MSDLHKLADTIEAAEAGSRELDIQIALATSWDMEHAMAPFATMVAKFGMDWAIETVTDHTSVYRCLPTFSTLIDSALSLLPEGWVWGGSACDPRGIPEFWVGERSDVLGEFWESVSLSHASTPALALCAAIIRSIAGESA